MGQESSAILRRTQAVDDVVGIVRYLAERSRSAAERFAESMDKTLAFLAAHPGVGQVFSWKHADKHELRA